jgi:type II restriction/modification system DNA methylase subunit YeeA
MTPRDFIAKWKASTLTERAASQSHFNDLCALVGHPTPVESDPTGERFTFERGAAKTGGGDGWADVWKKGCFAWEYKGKHKDLTAAFAQLQRYAIALENPPLLVVSDMETIVIHTNFTNTVQEIHTFALEELEQPEALQKLRWLFHEPERFRPGVTRRMVTEQAAQGFAGIAQQLRDAGFDSHRVAHFVNKLIFCMFAEDIGILPNHLFTRMVDSVKERPESFADRARLLFAAMRDGGEIGFGDVVPWFNGGLFDDDDALPLNTAGVAQLLACSRLDWSDIEPAIFGTLFERGLDPAKRSQLGAHYTDRDSIMRLVGPVVVEPLEREWVGVRDQESGTGDQGKKKAEKRYREFLAKLRSTRVLDPACGSGNFLYLSLVELKNLEHRVMLEGETLGFHRDFPQVGPQNVLGLEINDYAAELARVTVWIGDIQWGIKNGLGYSSNPILKKLDTIECRDALLTAGTGTTSVTSENLVEAQWPAADCIVGNPPFLGDKKMLGEMGEEYVNRLRKVYKGRVPGGADLVTYWFEKARAGIEAGKAQRVGLVATNSIRQKRNRAVLERIRETGTIFNAWSDEPWINDGAAVRVSLTCFAGRDHGQPVQLDGKKVADIFADLTGGEAGKADLTTARPLPENSGRSFFGLCLAGDFDVPGELARQWLRLPTNPNGRPNSDVLRPLYNGADVLKGHKDRWIIDFGPAMNGEEAALYEAPFQYVQEHVKPVRQGNREAVRAEKWWRHGRPRPELRKNLLGVSRYIATVETAKHRIFVWFPVTVAPEHKLIVIPRDDDTTFGILSSRFHVVWATAAGGHLGVGNDPVYNSTRCFETFPFPPGLTPDIPATDYADNPHAQAIAAAARRLVELRDNWLNPPEWVQRVPEVVPGYPDRLIPVDDTAAAELKKRTLTNLYNQRPAWLANAHAVLDAAVAAAYGWPADLADDDILSRLLALNHERSSKP